MLYANQYKYIPIARKWAVARNLPEDLVLGIIGVESGFNPRAYRREPHINDASYGLMQILERTAKGFGFVKPVFSWTHPLFDPETNVKYGTAYLQSLWNRYYGRRDDVIAAYNMGTPRRANETTPHIIGIYGRPKSSWVYANQPYVDAVNRNARYFKAVLDGNTVQADVLEREVRNSWKKSPSGVPLVVPALVILGLLAAKKQ